MGKREVGCFTVSLFIMSCSCYCSATLPRGAVGWSEVCDCGVSDHTHFLIQFKGLVLIEDTNAVISFLTKYLIQSLIISNAIKFNSIGVINKGASPHTATRVKGTATLLFIKALLYVP